MERVRSMGANIKEGTWARVKLRKYKGNLAHVAAINDASKKVTIKLVPRIDMNGLVAEKIEDAIQFQSVFAVLCKEHETKIDQELNQVENSAGRQFNSDARNMKQRCSFLEAAWIVDSDIDDNEHDDMELEGSENGFSGNDNVNDFELDDDNITLPGDFDDKTDTDSVMMDGENLTKEQTEEDIRRIKEAHAEEHEFSSEVDTPVDVPARRRFAKDRGLKSFRTSSWEPLSDGPPCRVEDVNFTSAKDNDDGNILLWSYNSVVVLADAGVHWIMTPRHDIQKIVKPLLRSSSSASVVVLPAAIAYGLRKKATSSGEKNVIIFDLEGGKFNL